MKTRSRIASTILVAALATGFGGNGLATTNLSEQSSSLARINSAAQSANIGARVVHQWRDASGTRIVLRVGTYSTSKKKGFGWVKILTKHRIFSVGTVMFVTKAPGGGVRQANGNYRYTAYANRKVCTKNSCYYTDSVPVLAIVSRSAPPSFHGVALGGGAIGVMTTYCANANRADACPAWVDRAFAGLSTSLSPQARASVDETTVELSYFPLTTPRSEK